MLRGFGVVLSWDVDFLWLSQCVVVSILLTWEKKRRKVPACPHRYAANSLCLALGDWTQWWSC